MSVTLPTDASYAGPSTGSGRAYRWLMASMLLLFVINIMVFASRPAAGSTYAVIVPPHLGQRALMETLAAADGTLVRESRYPWLAIVRPAASASEAGFASALRRSGALMLLHPAILAGCFTPNDHNELSVAAANTASPNVSQ